jgi:hypothetical protein
MPSSALSVKESSNWAEPVGAPRAGSRRGLIATVIATVAVTVAIAIPLVLIAGRADPPATSEGLVVLAGGEALTLEGATLTPDQVGELTLDMPGIAAASFGLYDDDRQVAAGEVRNGPPFVLADLGRLDLAPGTYDLLVSGTNPGGRTTRFAATFTVAPAE